jgi:hypothetical protein
LLLLAVLAQSGGELPPLPSSFRLCALAGETADYATGKVLEPAALAATSRARSVGVHVRGGTLPRGEATFTWDEGRPPIQLGKPTDVSYTYHEEALFLLDASRRLLVVSYEGEARYAPLLSALATARAPSRRFSEEELDWAWFASRCGSLRLRGSFSQLEGIEPQPGHVELQLRFGGLEKLEILGKLGGKPALDAQDVEWLELAAHDVGGTQDQAVRTLLEHGLPVPPAPFLSEGNRLKARLAAGDQAAEREVIARLERAERALLWDSRIPHRQAELEENEASRWEHTDRLLEIVAYGSPELRPRLTAFLQKDVKNSVFAWLALGGSAQELLALCGKEPRAISPLELTGAGTLDALDLELERVRDCAERSPERLSSELLSVDYLVRRLRARAPDEVLARVRPVLRACLELPGVPEVPLRASLSAAGDEAARAELARLSGDELRGIPRDRAEHLGDELVPILVELLVRYLAGFEHDDTNSGPMGVATIASRLHARSDADRARALRLFDAAELPPRATAYEVALVRWALGELPEPQRLLELGCSYISTACRLDLAGELPRYAIVLDELRANPRRHWWALAALHDEESIPVFGAWLTAKGDDRMAKLEALAALEKMGSPEGASWIFDALPELEPHLRDEAFVVLGAIESPERLARLATLCRPGPVTERGQSAGSAFLVLLGRRP